jgi:hypothetical protein
MVTNTLGAANDIVTQKQGIVVTHVDDTQEGAM